MMTLKKPMFHLLLCHSLVPRSSPNRASSQAVVEPLFPNVNDDVAEIHYLVINWEGPRNLEVTWGFGYSRLCHSDFRETFHGNLNRIQELSSKPTRIIHFQINSNTH